MISYFSEDVPLPDLNQGLVSEWIIECCLKFKGADTDEVSVVFCSDEYLLDMNQKHLDHDYYTDIITFEYSQEPVSGDLFISIDRVLDNANSLGIEFKSELLRVIIHGVLHLIGFKDKSDEDAREMRQMEERALELYVSRETNP